MHKQIPTHEITFNILSVGDDAGRVFSWNGALFRGVKKDHEAVVREMFSSGMLDALTAKGYIPKTSISQYETSEYALVLEHEIIPFVTYPQEWSFSMLKDVALFVLQVNDVARSYGFQTKDCHGYNVLFKGKQPMFVDIGSFVKVATGMTSLYAYSEFLSSYIYPLRIWSDGDYYLVRSLLNYGSLVLMPHETFARYRFPLFKHLFNYKLPQRLLKAWEAYKNIQTKSDADILDKIPSAWGARILWLKKNHLLPFTNYGDIKRLKRVVQKIREPKYFTQWEEYHDQYFTSGGEVISGKDRFDRVVEIVDSFSDIHSLVEVGGNQGLVSQLLSDKTSIEKIVCTDYDEQAVNLMHTRLKKVSNNNITLAVINFILPYNNTFEQSPATRFKSDAVMALAITHHLLLTQNIPIDYLMQALASFTNKYVFVEFMPMGLWDGKSAPPLPAWYTEEYFTDHFKKQFDLVSREDMNTNRVLFVGIKKSE